MKIKELETMWRSGVNQPSENELRRLASGIPLLVRNRARRFIGFISVVVAVLTGFTVIALMHILGLRGPESGMDIAGQWGLLPLLALPWIGAVLAIRRFCLIGSRYPDYHQPIVATLQALQAQARASMARARSLLFLHAVGIPVIAICVWQLHGAGKVRDHELTSMVVVLAVFIVVSVICLIGKYVREGRLERNTRELLESYQA